MESSRSVVIVPALPPIRSLVQDLLASGESAPVVEAVTRQRFRFSDLQGREGSRTLLRRAQATIRRLPVLPRGGSLSFHASGSLGHLPPFALGDWLIKQIVVAKTDPSEEEVNLCTFSAGHAAVTGSRFDVKIVGTWSRGGETSLGDFTWFKIQLAGREVIDQLCIVARIGNVPNLADHLADMQTNKPYAAVGRNIHDFLKTWSHFESVSDAFLNSPISSVSCWTSYSRRTPQSSAMVDLGKIWDGSQVKLCVRGLWPATQEGERVAFYAISKELKLVRESDMADLPIDPTSVFSIKIDYHEGSATVVLTWNKSEVVLVGQYFFKLNRVRIASFLAWPSAGWSDHEQTIPSAGEESLL